MKKIISLILAALLLTTLVSAALAESAILTPAEVVDKLLEYDQYQEDAEGQAANAAQRLAEMMVYIASLNAGEGHMETLRGILDTLNEAEGSDAGVLQYIGIGCVQTVQALIVLAQESDPDGVYEESLDAIIDAHNAGDADAETASEQIVNALFTCVKLTALIDQESCSTQDQFDQIVASGDQINADLDAAGTVEDQMAVGAKWLCKLLGAFAKLHNPDCAADIEAQIEGRESYIAEEEMGPKQALYQYLTGSIYNMGIFTGAVTMD